MAQINISYQESDFCGPEITEWLKNHLKEKFEGIMDNCPLYIGKNWNIEVVE